MRFSSIGLLLLLAAPVAAQDMPLSQILIDGEGWKLASGGAKSLPVGSRDKEGRVYIAQPEKQRIVVRDMSGQEMVFVENLAARDVAVGRTGIVYCTVPEEHAVYAIGPDKQKRKVADNITQPTGLAFWADQGTLVVADAAGNHLYAFQVEKDGSLTAREGYYTLRLPPGQKASGAAGMTVDDAGRLYVACTLGVQVYDPTGRLNGLLVKPTPTGVAPSAVAFVGPDSDQLEIRCGDEVYTRKIKAKLAGAPAK